MLKKHNYIAGLVASLAFGIALAPVVQAGTEVASGKEGKTVVTEAAKSFISGDLGVSVTNEYISRGIVQDGSAEGVIVQPYLDLYFKLYEGTGFINKVSLNLGLWSSLQSSKVDGTTSGVKNWYEFDYTVGIATTFEKNYTLTVSYFEFNYPAISSPGGDPQRSVNVSLAYDDTDLLGVFALHPHVTILQEVTGNTVGGHVGLGATETNGQYYEVGIAPSYTFLKDSKYPLTFTVPVTAGFGSSGFYAGNGFGYGSAGGVISVPLAFIPAGYGSWTASVGGTYYYLGKTTARVGQNSEFSVSAAQPHNRGVVTGTIGLTF
jgi:hypothetical protein